MLSGDEIVHLEPDLYLDGNRAYSNPNVSLVRLLTEIEIGYYQHCYYIDQK